MSAGYRAVQWNAHKRIYDAIIVVGVVLYVGLFVTTSKILLRGNHAISDEILVMRALGTCAIFMLNIVLCIGPLARLDRRFLPLLYNRRHLGVATFFVGLAHALLAVGFYHGFGRISPVASLFSSNTQYRSVSAFPFEILGLAGLLILFLMAATSHDFWLKNLSPAVWKRIHMLVYLAWGMLVLHVALGALQSERSWAYPAALGGIVAVVAGLHIAAGWRERQREVSLRGSAERQWVDAGLVSDIPESRAKTVQLPSGDRVAVYRYDGNLSAISNVCAHQGGPLGEGKIVGGCVTCPWHGYQYRPGDGCAPPPFTEKLRTYRVRLEGVRVWIHETPLEPGTAVEPAKIAEPVNRNLVDIEGGQR
jgi:nitrite reductase/ring-hydroxylating ferredoxin subunit/DMSO/TMAO reductase YedYZ heme-binding membrane subunit